MPPALAKGLADKMLGADELCIRLLSGGSRRQGLDACAERHR